MEKEQFIELLDSIHDFPGPFLFKAVGPNDGQFIGRVLAVFREQLRLAEDPDHRLRHTPAGRHVSVTVLTEVQTSGDVVEIYDQLRLIEGIVACM